MRKELIALVSLSLSGLAAFACAQTTRQVEIKVLDEVGKPLPDAHVIIHPVLQPIGPETAQFEPSSLTKTRTVIGRAKTNSDGMAIVDITSDILKDDDAVVATAWKLGYGPAAATLQKKAEISCATVQFRKFQILDSYGKPAQGLRVTRESTVQSEREQYDPPWWTTSDYTTDEFGLVSIETSGGSYQSLSVFEKDGTQHRFSSSSVDMRDRMSGRMVDWRDLSTVTLSAHGKLTGKLPSEAGQDYSVRLVVDMRVSAARLNLDKTSLLHEPKIESDGQFTFDAVAEGDYWLTVFRKSPYDGATDPPLQRQPVAVHHVTIEAGKTTSVEVGTESLTKVGGRLVADGGTVDFKGKLVVLSKKTVSTNNLRTGHSHALVRAVCAADGTFVAWVPAGNYQVIVGAVAGYRVGPIPEFEIGPGAASVTLDEIVLSQAKSLKVAWPGKPIASNTIQGILNSRLVFHLKDNSRVDCALTVDGFGKIDLPLGAEVVNIEQGAVPTARPVESTFDDLDESENFRLEMKKSATGTGANIGVSGKVVDADQKPLAGVPVSVLLTFEPVALPANANAVSYSSGMMGSQIIDVVTTRYDGTFTIPPRQLLRRITIPGRETENECKFIFTVSTLVNPDVIEARKTYQFKPSEWNVSQVDMPDLVIDRPLGGNRLTGKLLDAQGQPSAGELIRLNDKRHIVRTLTDREGNFEFEDVAGPTWLLREKDWSVRAVSDYSQPLVIPFQSSASPKPERPAGEPLWQRADLKERQVLAKEVLQGVINGQANGLADEAYLEPERYFQSTLLRGGANFDEARFQFVNFWTELKDEQLEQLASATVRSVYKAMLLKTLANRKPSAEAYKRAMDALEIPQNENYMADSLINEIAEVGVKLHAYGALEPYRGKIQQFLDYWTAQKTKERAQFNLPANLPNLPANVLRMATMEPDSVLMCRALLNPEEFAANMADQVQADSNELSPEERAIYSRNMAILMRLYPVEQLKLPIERLAISNDLFMEIGAIDPLAVIEAARQGKINSDALRLAVQAALANGHPDARAAFMESIPFIVQPDAYARLFSIGTARPNEIGWYRAAHRASPEIGRIAAWILAHDYLSGKYDDSASRMLPTMERRTNNMLGVAYSLVDECPALAKQIAERNVPRLFSQIESDYELPFSRSSDVSLAAYFDPKATVELLLKLQKRLDEEMKNQPARPGNSRMFSKRNSLTTLRQTCLRGLLLEEM